MYCKKCGAVIDDSAQFCQKCGTNVSHIEPPVDKTPMIIAMVMNILFLLSPFFKTFYALSLDVQSWELGRSTFSAFGTYKTVSDFISNYKDYFTYLNIFVDLSAKDAETLRGLSTLVLGVVAFDVIMYIIGFVEIIAVIAYFRMNQFVSAGKFWKAIISSVVAVFVGNTLVFGFILIANLTIRGLIERYTGIDSGNVMGGTAWFYAFQTISVITYFYAYIHYIKWKKMNKERIIKENYHESPDSIDLSSISAVTSSHKNERVQETWRCKRCGKINKNKISICQCGSPRGYDD